MFGPAPRMEICQVSISGRERVADSWPPRSPHHRLRCNFNTAPEPPRPAHNSGTSTRHHDREIPSSPGAFPPGPPEPPTRLPVHIPHHMKTASAARTRQTGNLEFAALCNHDPTPLPAARVHPILGASQQASVHRSNKRRRRGDGQHVRIPVYRSRRTV